MRYENRSSHVISSVRIDENTALYTPDIDKLVETNPNWSLGRPLYYNNTALFPYNYRDGRYQEKITYYFSQPLNKSIHDKYRYAIVVKTLFKAFDGEKYLESDGRYDDEAMLEMKMIKIRETMSSFCKSNITSAVIYDNTTFFMEMYDGDANRLFKSHNNDIYRLKVIKTVANAVKCFED